MRSRSLLTLHDLPLLLLAFSPLQGMASEWFTLSSPFLRISADYEDRIDALPSSGRTTSTAWSGPFWPERKGSIHYAWRSGKKPWKSPPPDIDRIRRLTIEEVAELPASVKFDLARNRYDFPLWNAWERDPKAKRWYGICTGWAQAALLYQEPTPVLYVNAEGLRIPFGSGDLKALLSHYYADEDAGKFDSSMKIRTIGEGCPPTPSKRDPFHRITCGPDVNAGALHIVLANRIGIEDLGLYADFAQGKAIKHHPLIGFESETFGMRPPSTESSPKTVHEVLVETRIRYAKYARAEWNPSGTSEGVLVLRYALELDSERRIVGGNYLSESAAFAPDTVSITDTVPFQYGFEILEKLVQPF